MMLPRDTMAWWLSLAAFAALATWRRPRWVGVWWGAALSASGWAYVRGMWGAALPPGYYALSEFLASVVLVWLGACLWLVSAAVLHTNLRGRHRISLRIAGALGLAATGFAFCYLGPC